MQSHHWPNLYDGRLYAHAPLLHTPRTGRIFPQGLWPNGVVTPEQPPASTIVAQAQACVGCPIIYFDEFDHPAWDGVTQQSMDLRAAITQSVRDVVGPKPRIVHYGWPVFGDMALRNVMFPWLWNVETTRANNVLRHRWDVIASRIKPSKIHALLGGAGISVYWNGGSNQYINGVTDPEAFSDCCDFTLDLCRMAGLEAVAFSSVMADPTLPGVATPQAIVDIVMAKFRDIIVWAGETQPVSGAAWEAVLQGRENR